MKEVTDPDLIAQLEQAPSQTAGGNVTDPSLLAQLNGPDQAQPQQQQMPAYARYPLDLLAGGLTAGQGIGNFLNKNVSSRLFPGVGNADFGQQLGITDPGLIDTALQNVGQYAPYAAAGEIGLSRAIPSMLARSGIEGAAFGGTQSQDPLTGMLEGGVSGLVGAVPAKIVGGLASMGAKYLDNTKLVKQAPMILQALKDAVLSATKDNPDTVGEPLNPDNISRSLRNVIKNNFKDKMATAKAYAEPLNNSKVEFSLPQGPSNFPNYQDAAKDLLANRDKLRDLFGDTSVFGPKLNRELDIADSFMGNMGKGKSSLILNAKGEPLSTTPNTASFQDIWGRIKDIGDMQQKAGQAGARKEARLLGNLKVNLSTDLQSNLMRSGNKALGDQLKTFNDFYRNNIGPHYDVPMLNKIVSRENYTPKSDALAKQLFDRDPASENVFNQLPQTHKDLALGELLTKNITKGKDADQLAQSLSKNWSSLTDDVKNRIISHSPAVASYMDKLASDVFPQKSALGLGGALHTAAGGVPKIGGPLQQAINMSRNPTAGIGNTLSRGVSAGLTPQLYGLSNLFSGSNQQ